METGLRIKTDFRSWSGLHHNLSYALSTNQVHSLRQISQRQLVGDDLLYRDGGSREDSQSFFEEDRGIGPRSMDIHILEADYKGVDLYRARVGEMILFFKLFL